LSGLVERISFIDDLGQQTSLAISSHFKSLLKLANNTDSIDPKYSVAYYSCNAIGSHFYYYCSNDEFQKALNEDFKKDLISLSSKELIAKYGTHILTNIYLGKKFEVLYRYESPSSTDAEHGLYKRLKKFCGGVFGRYISDYEQPLSSSNEQMIYNTIGLNPKQCGVVKTTDNNPDKLVIDIYPSFGTDINYQFVGIGKNGLTPLYELISDSAKKQEVKAYIETYIAGKSDVKK